MQSKTFRGNSWQIIKEHSEKNPCIRGISFRRNYGKSAALYHGFEAAEGRVVITMDADLQDSPEEIPELYRMVTEGGYDIVSGWKKQRPLFPEPLHPKEPVTPYPYPD